MSSINVFNEYIDFSYKSKRRFLKIVMEKYYSFKIFDELFDTYKRVRYFNEYKQVKSSFYDNLDYYILEKIDKLKKSGLYDSETIDITAYFLKIICIYDNSHINVDKFIELINTNRKDLLNFSSDCNKEIYPLLDEFSKKKKDFFEQFVSDNFKINYFLTNIRKTYNVNINYDLKFPKLYSEYAIDRVFNTDVIGEDKLFIEYYMVSSRILIDTINFDYLGHYLLEFCVSLFDKKEKFLRLLNIIDNDYVKEKVSLKITYAEFLKNKKVVSDLINKGFNFSVIIDDSYQDKVYDKECVRGLFKFVIVDINDKFYTSFEDMENIIKIK